MKKTAKRARGDRGENAAVRYLRFRFYRILDRRMKDSRKVLKSESISSS